LRQRPGARCHRQPQRRCREIPDPGQRRQAGHPGVHASAADVRPALRADQGAGLQETVLDSYQAKANAALDNAIGWNKLKPKMVDLYTSTFTEQELKDLVKFYESPLGKKVLREMPKVTQQSAQLTQQAWSRRTGGQQAAGRHDQELDPNAGKAPAKK
jgi:hypothetical protein